MQVSIENVPEIPIANNGVKIRVRDEEGANLGKLWFGQATIRWARGSVPEKNAKKLNVQEFVNYLNGLPDSN